MVTDLHSEYLQRLPKELLRPGSEFAQDLAVLVANAARLPQLGPLVRQSGTRRALPEPLELQSAAREMDWEPAAMRSAIKCALVLLAGMSQVSPGDTRLWGSDLVRINLLDPNEVARFDEIVRGLRPIAEELAREQARLVAELGVLPSYDSLDFTTELRRVRGSPEVVGICSMRLQLDIGPQTQVFFQANEDQLRQLAERVEEARRELRDLLSDRRA